MRPDPTAADEAAVALPAEGAWARYHGVYMKDGDKEASAKVTLKFLGRVVVKGEPCRWIETVEQITDPAKTLVNKFLVPERALRESQRPLDQAVRYITQTDGKGGEASAEFASLSGWALLFLPEVLKGSKETREPVVVDYQPGKLTIPQGQKGEYVWTRKSNRWAFEYNVWLHQDVPVGFAHAKMKLRVFSDDIQRAAVDSEYFLEDTGKDAKSVVSPEEGRKRPN